MTQVIGVRFSGNGKTYYFDKNGNYVTGTQIRTLRENKKLTQEQLAAALDISVIELLSPTAM